VIKCGSTEIDGYAFCLGVKSLQLSYMASPALQVLPSVIYLIEHAGLRSKYTANSPERFSLEIRSLAELIDMFHTRHASDPRDKVYALLGMSLDDPSIAILQPDYTISLEKLFKQLVKYILSEVTFVENSSQTPRIESKGCILGQVSSVKDNGQNVNIIFTSKNATWYRGDKIEWTIRASAKSIQESDIVCLLQGASKPTIIRLYKDHFAIIIIAVTPLEERRGFKQLERFQSITRFPRDFLLVWDLEQLLKKSQDLDESNNQMSFDQATMTWNVALILRDLEEYEKAEERLREAIKGYEIEFGEQKSMLKGQYDLTPLSWAAGNGNDAIVDLLLVKDNIDPDLKDGQGLTPLWRAAQNGHEIIVKLLLATGQVEVDLKDKQGLTPLWRAAENGHEVIVKLLLATGQVEANLKDKWGLTLLWRAAQNGHEAIVKLLLATGQVEIDLKDKQGRTPLSRAAENGHEAVVKLLLATGQVEVDLKDRQGWTPLRRAVQNGQEAVVKLLLATGQVEVDLKNEWGLIPPLWRAAENGHEAIVKLLLAICQVEVNLKDGEGRTPLSRAAENGHEVIIKLLLATGQVKVDLKDKQGRTPFWWAAQNGHEAIVKLLLATGQVEVDLKDNAALVGC
jgi:ankyrin repeat protein